MYNTEMSKELGERWKSLDESEKKVTFTYATCNVKY